MHHDGLCNGALRMDPVLPIQEKVYTHRYTPIHIHILTALISQISRMTMAVILDRCRTNDWDSISYLNLHGNSIGVMESLSQLRNLRVLILTFNEIRRIQGVLSS